MTIQLHVVVVVVVVDAVVLVVVRGIHRDIIIYIGLHSSSRKEPIIIVNILLKLESSPQFFEKLRTFFTLRCGLNF